MKSILNIKKHFPVIPLLVAAGLASISEANGTEMNVSPQTPIIAALENPHRPAADKVLDGQRKPAEVLSFFNIKPGMKVLEVFPGPGYYSEILNDLVGEGGQVTLYSHTNWYFYSKKQSDKRHQGKRLKRTKMIISDLNTLKLPEAEYDAATIILGLHDLFLTSEKSVSGENIDTAYFLRALYNGLKPGGTLGVVEHNIPAGISAEKSAELHRLSREFVRSVMEKAGFVLESESDILRNDKDDYTKHVFEKETRRKTDRLVMRFIKPVRG